MNLQELLFMNQRIKELNNYVLHFSKLERKDIVYKSINFQVKEISKKVKKI